MGLKLEL